jgi:DNA repair ATPase RecN
VIERRVNKLNTSFRDVLAEKKVLKRELEATEEDKIKAGKRLVAMKKARALLQEVAQQTQKKLEYSVETLVTLALNSVFPNAYDFKVQFEQKRNKTECSLWFNKSGDLLKPLDSSGGGPIDVAALALRMTFWRISDVSPVLILDEPLKFVSADYREACGLILKELSSKLGVQIIMVTHLPELVPFSDKKIEIGED